MNGWILLVYELETETHPAGTYGWDHGVPDDCVRDLDEPWFPAGLHQPLVARLRSGLAVGRDCRIHRHSDISQSNWKNTACAWG